MKFFRVLNHIFGTIFLGKKINRLNKNKRYRGDRRTLENLKTCLTLH